MSAGSNANAKLVKKLIFMVLGMFAFGWALIPLYDLLCEITGLGRISGTVTAIEAPRASALGVGHQPTDTPEVQRVALGFDERVPEHLKNNLKAARKGA